jgi:hypothetical protein
MALAQVVGANLAGRITDEGGLALPGVTVTVTNKGTGVQQAVVTSDEGTYRLVALQPGSYHVLVEIAGFAPATRDVVLTVGANATADVQLGVAALEESITVTAQSPLVEVSRAAPTSTIVQSQIQALPAFNRFGCVGGCGVQRARKGQRCEIPPLFARRVVAETDSLSAATQLDRHGNGDVGAGIRGTATR